ncbi:aromatic ring-hydroxylating dioxygenase subunit alpha [Leptothoe kymatousa]|uniref:Rieske 2Fe-2S domain-containing protein n=1 Tax=Leptothoe kymatousa TAU-MAC 1615 TaxID=2364775 RepID=A0ABS5Y3K0_9CYAN|nr:Rieske 2Fe-2S domain-containing protein [Leptothoe kymatousa]MBT9312405.1 Rieske 2Fe-2S domain-containing protein [Leptothoe kymatousa TAU-MAC 1615]
MTATHPERLAKSSVPLAAGGPDPQRFDWFEAWYPVHYVEDLDKAKPTRFTLLGQDVVIWWEPTAKTWRVLADQCPHRLAPLSEGRINEAGQLECPYHGWAFSGEGLCEHIPQQPPQGEAHRSNRACVASMPTDVRQGLLFVYPGKPENAARVEVPIIDPVVAEPDGWVMLNTFRDLPYDALTLLENVLDASHIPYTHHKTVGKRENAAPMQMDVVSSGKQGFQGVWPEGPRKGALGTQHTTFVAPALMYHDLTSKQFGRTLTVVYATPMRKGECRLFARFPFKFSSKLPAFFIKRTPRWFSHVGNNRVLEDDQIFLHLQERLLEKEQHRPYAQSCYLPTQADRYVVAFRKWISDFEANPFEGEPLPPEQSIDMLMDRYGSHTKHCGSCGPALKRIQAIRKGAIVLSAAIWSLVPLLVVSPWTIPWWAGASLTAVPLLAGALWLWLGDLEQKLYKGDPTPPRNLS